MKDKFRVGILSTIDNPLLPIFVDSILYQKINDVVVICDEKKIWKQRTGNFFESYETGDKNIYANRDAEIPVYFVKNHNSNYTQQLINSLSINVLLNAGTPRKLSKEILQSSPSGVVNVHPGLLPEYRCCSAVE
ncbi:formyltransferase family protein [Alphaproteobacteria bacterium]|nr:formyltransferase family protein [Alphaproteobacteria bacterium]